MLDAASCAGDGSGPSTATASDAGLCSALGNEAVERVMRYSRSHERALLADANALREIVRERRIRQRGQRVDVAAIQTGLTDSLGDDAACEKYLEGRMRDASYRCPHCGEPRGYWLDSRHRWECASCRKQSSTRTGTVMSGSPLRISVWISAIKTVIAQPEITATSLAASLRIRRVSTVRGILRKIRAAIASPQRGILLADLDQVFCCQAPETGASEKALLQNEN
jgi:transposase-like protein